MYTQEELIGATFLPTGNGMLLCTICATRDATKGELSVVWGEKGEHHSFYLIQQVEDEIGKGNWKWVKAPTINTNYQIY